MGEPRDQAAPPEGSPTAADLERRCLRAYESLLGFRVQRDLPKPAQAVLDDLSATEDLIGRGPSAALAEARERAAAALDAAGAVPEPKLSHAEVVAMQPELKQRHQAAQGRRS
jgi:hypothetical protein